MTDPSRPGTELFAPEARFVDYETGRELVFADAIDPTRDLISVQITQTHNGVSQLSLELSNYRIEGRRPVYPPWKYNDLAALKFGQRLRIDMRYAEQPWHAMIVVRVTNMSFKFPSDNSATVTVEGEDLLSLFKVKPSSDKRYRNKQELQIINDVLERSGSHLPLAAPLIPRHVYNHPLSTVTHQKSNTFLQFVESLAERMDYEVFVDVVDPIIPRGESSAEQETEAEQQETEQQDETSEGSAAAPDSESSEASDSQQAQPRFPEVKFHFEEARSLSAHEIMDLHWNKNVIDFTPKFKIWEQFTQAVSRGRNPRNRERIEATARVDAITVDLHIDPSGNYRQDELLNAIQARERFFTNDNPIENVEPLSVANLDRDRAQTKAAAALRKRAREFLTAKITTVGLPELRPGIHANLHGFSAPFDGMYYITEAVHTLDNSGYKTRCSLRRPGMLNPDLYFTALSRTERPEREEATEPEEPEESEPSTDSPTTSETPDASSR